MLEILPGFVSWSMILFPIWGSFLWPVGVAYYIITFDVYWFYRSVSMSIFALLAYYRMKASSKYDWMGDVDGFDDWKKVRHVVVIPNYKEPLHTLDRLLDSLAKQTFPAKQIIPVVAFESRAGKEINEPRKKALEKKYEGVFDELIFSEHPLNIPGEVIGKSSNAAWGAKAFRKVWKKRPDWEKEYMTISSADADVMLHPNHMAALSYKFLDSPHRYRRIWQGAVLYYNNIERIPWMMRVFNRVSSIVQLGMLMRPDRLINFSTYSLSLVLMEDAGYWDTDVIPEDYRMLC
jgi:cellulose synthase/poly-beta-1,6-N-acetylglucosamine synthase-like glycosyltransferase